MPNDAETLSLLVNCLLISDRADEADSLIRRLMSVDPLTPLTACMPGWKLLLDGDFDAALPHYRRMYDLDPGNPMALAFMTWSLALAGRDAEIEPLVPSNAPAAGNNQSEGPVIQVARFLAAAKLGRDSPERWLDSSIDAMAEANDILPRLLADGHALLGDADSAVAWLRVAVDRGFIHYPFLAQGNPLLRSLDGHSGFRALLAEVRDIWQQRLSL